jgi:UDP-glucose 4-epimerase
MKVVVIGGAGYLGRPLVRRLRAHADVVSVGRRGGDGVDERVDLRDGDAVRRLLEREKPEAVVVSAYMLDRATNEDPLRAVETNVLGMTHVFQAAADLALPRVVFASSGAVHGSNQDFDRAVDEAVPCRPTTLYGQMKVFDEWLAAHYNANFGTEIVSYRISGPYGWGKPHDRQGGEMPFDFVVDAARTRERVALPWSASTRFRFIHVDDAAASFVPLVLAPSLRHRVYNSPGFTVAAQELADAARSISGLACEFTEPGRPVKFVWWDATRYEAEFAFRPRPMAWWMREELRAPPRRPRPDRSPTAGLGSEPLQA